MSNASCACAEERSLHWPLECYLPCLPTCLGMRKWKGNNPGPLAPESPDGGHELQCLIRHWALLVPGSRYWRRQPDASLTHNPFELDQARCSLALKFPAVDHPNHLSNPGIVVSMERSKKQLSVADCVNPKPRPGCVISTPAPPSRWNSTPLYDRPNDDVDRINSAQLPALSGRESSAFRRNYYSTGRRLKSKDSVNKGAPNDWISRPSCICTLSWIRATPQSTPRRSVLMAGQGLVT